VLNWARSVSFVYVIIHVYEYVYSKPSLIRLQLVMSDNPDRNMNSSVHSWIHMGFRSKRAFRPCWGQLERLKPRKKTCKIGLSWLKGTLDFSFWQRNKLLQCYFLSFIFFSATYIITFLFFFYFRAIFCFINPDDLPRQLIRISESLLYI
jgi:hypothetical protein